MMKLAPWLVALLFALLLISASAHAQPVAPLEIVSPVTIPAGEMHVRLGAGYLHDDRLIFQDENKHRRVFNIPSFDVALGVAPNTELLFHYPLMYLDQDGQSADYGSGDLVVEGVFKIFQNIQLPFEWAFKLGVKLPNADDEKEFGTDETDFFTGIATMNQFGSFSLLTNVEIAILSNPHTEKTEQDDVLLYKIAGVYTLNEEGAYVVLGLEGIEFSRFDNERGTLKAGLAWPLKYGRVDLGLGKGVTGRAAEFSACLGFTAQFGEQVNVSCPAPRDGTQ